MRLRHSRPTKDVLYMKKIFHSHFSHSSTLNNMREIQRLRRTLSRSIHDLVASTIQQILNIHQTNRNSVPRRKYTE